MSNFDRKLMATDERPVWVGGMTRDQRHALRPEELHSSPLSRRPHQQSWKELKSIFGNDFVETYKLSRAATVGQSRWDSHMCSKTSGIENIWALPVPVSVTEGIQHVSAGAVNNVSRILNASIAFEHDGTPPQESLQKRAGNIDGAGYGKGGKVESGGLEAGDRGNP
ncbi:hypothetical protein BKA70DRAFT_1227739 [Coprinopsis sp. MPI-PUGE-AT-0042]|nr:hypothetical protein BKA70DRAFT_1227739 [Coprinopsis sp. MPI-PUGE-AT-0042]